MDSQNGLATHSFLSTLKLRGMVMNDGLREIHINSCLARIVMYSQGHIC